MPNISNSLSPVSSSSPKGNVNSVDWTDGMERWSVLATEVEYWTGLLECHTHL